MLTRRQALAGALFLLAFWLVGLGRAPLFDVDEGAFAQASREMLSSGDWLHTTLNGADRFDKPILVYWLQAASMAAFGPTEFAARLPSALCGWLWCMALGAFAARQPAAAMPEAPPDGLSSWERGLMAAGLATGCLGIALIGRAATADALLNLLLTLACLDLFRHLQLGERRALRRLAVWCGLAVLTKGPIGVLIPAMAAVAWCVSRLDGRPLLALLRDPIALCLFLVCWLPWYGYAVLRHGERFVSGFLLRHNLERMAAPLEGHSGSGLYVWAALLMLMVPATPLLWPVLRRVRGHWSDPLTRFLLLWALSVLVFFTAVATKLPHYALYAASPVLLLMARELPSCSRSVTLSMAGLSAALIVLFALMPDLVDSQQALRHALRLPDDATRADLPQPWSWPVLVLVSAGVIALALPGALSGLGRPGRRVLVGALTSMAVLVHGLLPWWAELQQGPIKSLGKIAGERGWVGLTQWQVHQPSFGFYAGRIAPRKEPQPGEFALTTCALAQAAAVQPGFAIADRRLGWCLLSRVSVGTDSSASAGRLAGHTHAPLSP